MEFNKMIANNIITYAKDRMQDFNYIISVDDYISKCSENEKKYINDNLEDICLELERSEEIASLDLNNNEIDMVFYLNAVFTEQEEKIYGYLSNNDLSLDLEYIREISDNIYNDVMYKQVFEDNVEKIINRELSETVMKNKVEYNKNKDNLIVDYKKKEIEVYLKSDIEHCDKEVMYIFENPKNGITIALAGNEDETITFNENISKDLAHYTMEGTDLYNIDFDVLNMLSEYKLLYMNDDVHLKMWETISELYPTNELDDYKFEIKEYIKFCKEKDITVDVINGKYDFPVEDIYSIVNNKKNEGRDNR